MLADRILAVQRSPFYSIMELAATREAEIVEVPPAAKISKEVWRWEYGSMPKVLTLSILGLQLGDTALKLPTVEFTPETEKP